MNDVERSRTAMFGVVRSVCRTHFTVLSSYSPFLGVFTPFENSLDEMDGWLAKQSERVQGAAITKQKRKLALAEDALLLSSMLFIYARKEELDELVLRVKYSPSDLKKSAANELTGICYQLLQDGRENVAGLTPYGIDANWLNAFEGKIEGFSAVTGAPEAAWSARKKATDELKRLIPETGDWLRTMLDPLMEHFKSVDATIYGEYKNARVLVNTGHRKPALKGHVTDSEGNPVKGLIVRIAGTTRKSITSEKGNFRFIQMKMGKYTVVVFDKKTEMVRKTVDVPHEGILELRIADNHILLG